MLKKGIKSFRCICCRMRFIYFSFLPAISFQPLYRMPACILELVNSSAYIHIPILLSKYINFLINLTSLNMHAFLQKTTKTHV